MEEQMKPGRCRLRKFLSINTAKIEFLIPFFENHFFENEPRSVFYMCSVFRPSGTSYLYMENVKLMGCKKGCEISGHEAHDNNGMLDGNTEKMKKVINHMKN